MVELIETQQAYWNAWNAAHRERRLSVVSLDQRDMVVRWLNENGRRDLDLIEVGCGAGWLCPTLSEFGRVTAIDFADEVVARAAQRMPEITFIAGDFMALDLPSQSADVVVALEVLAHVGEHDAFVAKLAGLLRPGGLLIMASQNRPVMERHNRVKPLQPGHLRRWFDRDELHQLLAPHVVVREIVPITPYADKGVARFVAGRVGRGIMRMSPGRVLERALAPLYGRTLMVRAHKPEQ